ncbi:hypothetical protein C8J56DRAFT_1051772 [Mycena floridula]|nr:hypothetical protein C8J56DRAFT_1051772 [Mycena floridula]
MSTISTALRNFKEPTKDQLTQRFFSILSVSTLTLLGDEQPTTTYPDIERRDINAVVLSMGAGNLYIIAPYATFASSVR